ncbi:MAG: hypothetical protein GTN78_22465 [Gemmatimonadales bacterium]|nr:hypothetical protein [Gemmatimonadales bacterium]NIR02931.1 hypothetical protein [Gemmatimonadales bacterium]
MCCGEASADLFPALIGAVAVGASIGGAVIGTALLRRQRRLEYRFRQAVQWLADDVDDLQERVDSQEQLIQ